MPFDLRTLVDETIAREEKELNERLAAARQKQCKTERSLAEQMLLLRYVEEEVAKDPAIAPTWDALSLADALQNSKKVLAARGSSPGTENEDRLCLLGLSPERILPSQIAVKEFQADIIPRVAQRIEDDRDSLVQFCKPILQKRSTPSPSPLCDAIEDLLARVATEKGKLAEKEEKKEEMLLTLANIFDNLLSKAILLLRENYPIAARHQVLDIRQNLARMKCLNLKAKVTQLNLMTRCYTPEKLHTLMTVRYSLDKKISEVEKEFAKWSVAARSFDAVDPSFLEVVKEFKSVLDQIHAHEFVLKEYASLNDKNHE